jgi:uroporphyrinogen-III synthase
MRTAVVTLSPGAVPGLVGDLRRAGITARNAPLLWYSPPERWDTLDGALSRVHEYGAIAATSPRAARALIERASRVLLPDATFPTVWGAGDRTVHELRRLCRNVRTAAPGESERHAAALARVMLAAGVRGPVLYACGTPRRDDFAATLRASRIQVEEATVFRAQAAPPRAARVACRNADVAIVDSVGVAELIAVHVHRRPPCIAVGRGTARAAASMGWTPVAVVGADNAGDVVNAVLAFFSGMRRSA